MGAVQLGDANIIFGIIDGSLGYWENLSFNNTGETNEILDGCGAIIAAFLTGDKFNVSGTFVLDSTASVPTRGDKITAGQLGQGSQVFTAIGDLYVTDVTEEFSNSDALKVAIEASHWPNI